MIGLPKDSTRTLTCYLFIYLFIPLFVSETLSINSAKFTALLAQTVLHCYRPTMDKLKSYKLYDIVLSSTLTNFIPDGLTGILYRHYPSGRTSALGSIRSTTEMSTRSILGSNGGRCVGLRTFMCRLSRNSGSLKLLEPSRSVQPCIGVALPFTLTNTF